MNCEKCGQAFEAHNRNGGAYKKRFCSERCRKGAERKRSDWYKRNKAKARSVFRGKSSELLMPRDGLCGSCRQVPVQGRVKYCSDRCRSWKKRCWEAGYELTIPEYEAMKAAAGGRCQACGDLEGDRPLQIDHCHSSGAVRGLICNKCNCALAHAKDSVSRLQGCIEYLNRGYEANHVP